MKVTLESTDRVIQVEPAEKTFRGRIWEGRTESGIHVVAVIVRIGHSGMDSAQEFLNELSECKPPSRAGIEAFPLRMVI